MENPETTINKPDPTVNVKSIVKESITRLDDLRNAEIKRIDRSIEVEIGRVNDKFNDIEKKFDDVDVKYQIQFNAAKEALGIALIAQEKAVAAALDSTKEAIGKAEIATDKRFDLLSEKIDGVNEILNKNTGAQGIYVTHSDLQISLDKLQTNIEATLRPVITFMNNSQGQQKGASTSWQTVVTIIGACGALIAIFFALSK